MIEVEIIYIPSSNKPFQIHLHFETPLTIRDVLIQSKVWTQYPETADLPVGIFGQLVPLDTPIKTGDRIEIYRPLLCDPKDKRKKRAAETK